MPNFTGFGGLAFMPAVLTLFYTPLAIVSKILVIELTSGSYLFVSSQREITWRNRVLRPLKRQSQESVRRRWKS